MIRALLPALALACCATAAQADARLQQVMYDEYSVVTVPGRVNVQASIIFGDDETIENVAIGNSQTWQVTPNKRANILFVKPLEPRATTNLTVVTNKRTYLFDLVANPTSRPLYVLRSEYPVDPEEEARKAQLAQTEAKAKATATPEAPFAAVDPADLNFAWSAQGDTNLLPQQTFDDGEATFLSWPEGREVPAILMLNAKGDEGPVNFTVRGDTIVIDGVPRTIVLRSGEASATLINTGPERSAKSIQRDEAALNQQRNS